MFVLRRVTRKTILPGILRRCYSREGRIIGPNLPDLTIPDTSIPDFMFDYFSKWDENRIALECGMTGRKYNYKQTRDMALRLNKSLRKTLNLQRHDVVALLLPNVPEFPIAVLGVLKAGLVVTTINPTYTPGEINKQLLDSNAKTIITLVDLYPLAKGGIKDLNIPIVTIKMLPGQSTPEGAIDFQQLADNDQIDLPEVNDISPSDLAILPYSSGTTGLPKGVRLLHSNIVANVSQMEHPDLKTTPAATADFQAVIPAILPMFHIYGLTALSVLQLICGAKTVTLPKFIPELYLNTLAKYKPHVLYLAPPIVLFLANNPHFTKIHSERLKFIVSGAAPLGALDEQKVLKKVHKDVILMQGFGMTETSPGVLTTRKSIKRVMDCYGSVGVPMPNTLVKIIDIDDKEGKPLGPNQKGELLVKGPQVMPGYHNRPKETEEIFMDGWLRTGDIMYYDENGLFYITDRIKELIKVKGFQVAPAELEEIIREHPDVTDAAVFGVPHPKDGEVPKAIVVPIPGAAINVDQIMQFVDEKVAVHKRLRGGIVVADAIPKNMAGKILRRELKQKYP